MKCPSTDYRCNNTRCVFHSWLCDGDDDCGDSSDESNSSICGMPVFHCPSGQWKCPNIPKTCINVTQVCDSNRDCPNGMDEGPGCDVDNCKDNLCSVSCIQTPNVSWWSLDQEEVRGLVEWRGKWVYARSGESGESVGRVERKAGLAEEWRGRVGGMRPPDGCLCPLIS